MLFDGISTLPIVQVQNISGSLDFSISPTSKLLGNQVGSTHPHHSTAQNLVGSTHIFCLDNCTSLLPGIPKFSLPPCNLFSRQ